MLGKLIKYEFKATGRLLLPVYGALLLMGGVVNLGLTLQGKLPVLKFAQGVLIFAYVALMVAAFALSFFVVISRFYKNLICDEGYLMFTLPVKAGTHLLAKTVVSTVWSVGTCLAAVGSLLLMGAGHGIISQLPDVLRAANVAMKGELGMGMSELLIWTLFTVLVSLVVTNLMCYLSISIGQFGRGHRILTSVGAYLVLNVVIQSISTVALLVACLFTGLDFFGDVPLGQMAGFLRMVFALSIGLNVFFGGCFYAGSNFILSRKLNLE